MRILKSLEEIKQLNGSPNAIVLGNFDGVHKGHQQLIRRCVNDSHLNGWESCALTFDPHPATVISGGKPVKLINTTEQRYEMISSLGIQNLIVLPFDEELAATEPEEFVSKYLFQLIGVASIYIGFNYSFGKHGAGTPELLKILGKKYGFAVIVANPVLIDNETVSSTLIRAKYAVGSIASAAGLLGYWPILEGEVVSGDQRGRQIGFSTANIAIPEYILLPAFGVYAAYAEIIGQDPVQLLPAVLNIGVKPTFHSTKLTVEVHILDFSGDLYRKRLKVHLREKLRDETFFDSVSKLKQQISMDIKKTRDILKFQEPSSQ